MLSCPCGTGEPLSTCCGRYLDAGERPETAEQLMRSRYTAYVLQRSLYLRDTWHPRTRPVAIDLDAKTQWVGLTVHAHERQNATHATVEFVARFRERGAVRKLHELSTFEKIRDRWLYVDGELLD